jgi:hypothetical protein
VDVKLFVDSVETGLGNQRRQFVIEPLAAQLDAQTPLAFDPVAGLFQAKEEVPTL